MVKIGVFEIGLWMLLLVFLAILYINRGLVKEYVKSEIEYRAALSKRVDHAYKQRRLELAEKEGRMKAGLKLQEKATSKPMFSGLRNLTLNEGYYGNKSNKKKEKLNIEKLMGL